MRTEWALRSGPVLVDQRFSSLAAAQRFRAARRAPRAEIVSRQVSDWVVVDAGSVVPATEEGETT